MNLFNKLHSCISPLITIIFYNEIEEYRLTINYLFTFIKVRAQV